MGTSLLAKAYDSEEFRKTGHLLIDQLADHLNNTINEKNNTVLAWRSPEEELHFWKNTKKGTLQELYSEIINSSIHTHHPKYIGHQIAPTLPIAALSNLISSTLNNGMAVYEMGKASSVIEKMVTDTICNAIGYDTNARGLLTSGGTLATLTALLSARKAIATTNVWKTGAKKQLGIMVSEEAHYCVDRAARIMGLGDLGILKIPVTDTYAMDTSQLDSYLQKAKDNAIEIIAIVGSAPSTASGIYDDLEAIAAFAQQNNIWFHIDGAHGGAAIFSKKHKTLLKGITSADSVVIDGHKMLLMPGITTALLYKNGENSHATFSQKADYLLSQSDDEDWYNLAKRTFECTKNMMSINWYTALQTYGTSIFEEYVDTTYDLAKDFYSLVENSTNFEAAIEPHSNIVCFRYVNQLPEETTNTLNQEIRQYLLEDGEFYIVSTKFKGTFYLRVTIMNPFTKIEHFKRLLEKIENYIDSVQ